MRASILTSARTAATLVLVVLPVAAKEKAAGLQPSDLAVERCNDVVVRDRVAYVALSRALALRDVSDPANPRTLSRLDLPGDVVSVALEGQRAYLGLGGSGVAVVDVSDPRSPQLLGRHDTTGSVQQVAVSDAVVFLADNIRGVEIVDLSDPTRPRPLASVPTRDRVRAVAMAGGILATAEGTGGVRLFDVSKPGVPHLIATVDGILPILDARLCGSDTLVVAAEDRGVHLFDVTTVSRPREVASLATRGPARRIACRDHLVAVSCGDAGVLLADLSRRSAPRVLSGFKLPRGHPAGRVSLAGDLLFVATDVGGLGIVDVKDPVRPGILLPRARKMNVRFPE